MLLAGLLGGVVVLSVVTTRLAIKVGSGR